MLDRSIQPAIKAIDEINISVPERGIMTNGTRLNIIRAGSQEVVRLDILIKGGQWLQTQPLQAMFTNRMLREGTIRFVSSEIAEKLDYYGAWMELSASMSHSFLTLYSLNKYFVQTLDVIESIIMEPTFPEKELSIVTDINKQQFLVNSTKVDNIARKQLNRSLFGVNHPCGKFAEAGDYDNMNTELLKEFYKQFYSSGNCSIYISGNVTREIIASIERVFGEYSWGYKPDKADRKEFMICPATEKRIFIERPEAMQSSIKLGALSIERSHPDFHKMKVLMTLFGGYFGSRLMSNIREDKGYTYGIAAGLVSYPDSGVLMVSTEAANEYVENIIREVYHEMDILQNELVSGEELSKVKNYLLGDMCRSYEGPFSLSDAWIFIECGDLDDTFFRQSLDATQHINSAEIKELARKYLCKEALIEVIAGKKM